VVHRERRREERFVRGLGCDVYYGLRRLYSCQKKNRTKITFHITICICKFAGECRESSAGRRKNSFCVTVWTERGTGGHWGTQYCRVGDGRESEGCIMLHNT